MKTAPSSASKRVAARDGVRVRRANEHGAFRIAVVAIAASAALVLQASCARSIRDDVGEEGFGFDAAAAPERTCADTTCPAPLATCPGTRNRLGPCSVNLNEDVEHCGACNTPCPTPTASTHGVFLCSEGQCRLACAKLYADCNESSADGCETATESDPANCGFCKNACKEGELCWKGACGCPNGFTRCGDDCVKLDSDSKNCGACGKKCSAPESDTDPRWTCGPGVTPPNTDWACGGSSCNLSCKESFADCNQAFCDDGCETNVNSDPANCGACGHACSPEQWCEQGVCACAAGTVRCEGSSFFDSPSCVDLSRDPLNCGACGHECPGQSEISGSPGCQDGACTYVCSPGYANCNKTLADGCEVNLQKDQKHCGSCGTSCDVGAGQPCIQGKCPTQPCESGVVR